MKALNKMDNVDKGRLLADLFPLELANITQYIQREAEQIRKQEQFIRTHWASTLFNVNFWFSLLENVDKKIKKNGTQLHKKHRWFADQLFDGYDALFTLYCLQELAIKKDCNRELAQAIHLFFGEARLILTNPNKPDIG
ncbi:MAG: hypothetical protein J7577_22925 [Sphingobacteriaceae bacterium]|nr:hypothetical protein [Sphingobacteriaceae bacterium]